jgi:hypothetical protein
MHKDVEPRIENGEIYCHVDCDHKDYIGSDSYCKLSDCLNPYKCIPWYQNKVEELENESKKVKGDNQ